MIIASLACMIYRIAWGPSTEMCIQCRVLASGPLFAAKPFCTGMQSRACWPLNNPTTSPGSCCPLKFDISQPDFDSTPNWAVKRARLTAETYCMSHLEALALENLAAPPHATTILSSLAKLQDLHMTLSTTVTDDLQPCTELTYLSFSQTCRHRAVILLPTSAMGGDASLANLKLSSICNVHNLGFALQLTCLGMSSANLQHNFDIERRRSMAKQFATA